MCAPLLLSLPMTRKYIDFDQKWKHWKKGGQDLAKTDFISISIVIFFIQVHCPCFIECYSFTMIEVVLNFSHICFYHHVDRLSSIWFIEDFQFAICTSAFIWSIVWLHWLACSPLKQLYRIGESPMSVGLILWGPWLTLQNVLPILLDIRWWMRTLTCWAVLQGKWG